MFCFFDLDGTLIDSSHRRATLADGTLDLDHWIENSHPEMIARDAPLPMIQTYHNAVKHGGRIFALTARVLDAPDFKWMSDYGLKFEEILSRPNGCTMNDAALKDAHLRFWADRQGLSWADFCEQSIIFDDCPSVLRHLSKLGLDCIDARRMNEALAMADLAKSLGAVK